MKCIICNSVPTVTRSFQVEDGPLGTFRDKHCLSCGYRFKTFQPVGRPERLIRPMRARFVCFRWRGKLQVAELDSIGRNQATPLERRVPGSKYQCYMWG